MDNTNAEHLSDGAYVSKTYYGIVFTANHHEPSQATDKVYLNFDGIFALKAWLERALKDVRY